MKIVRWLRIIELCDSIELGCAILIYFACLAGFFLSKAGVIT